MGVGELSLYSGQITGCHVLGRTNTKGTSQSDREPVCWLSESLSHLKQSFVHASRSWQGGRILSFQLVIHACSHRRQTFSQGLEFYTQRCNKTRYFSIPLSKTQTPSKHSHALHSSHTVSDSHASFMISNIRPSVSRQELTHTCKMPTITRKSSLIEGKVWAMLACQEWLQADSNNSQGERREAKTHATHTLLNLCDKAALLLVWTSKKLHECLKWVK